MSYLYTVSVAFGKKEWNSKVQNALKGAGGKKHYEEMMSMAMIYEDKDCMALKWSEVNHFFDTVFAKELDKIAKKHKCDYIVSGEDGSVKTLRRDLGYLSVLPAQGILPDETSPMNKDGIIVQLVKTCLLQGLSEGEIGGMAISLDGYPFSGRDKVMSRYIAIAKKQMGFDDDNDVTKDVLGNITLTLKGLRELDYFMREAAAQKKEILDGCKDTCEDTPPLTEADVLSEVGACLGEGDFNNEYLNGWGITDTYTTDYPLCMRIGEHFNIENPEMWMTSVNVEDIIGELTGYEVAIPNFVVGEKAIIRKDSKETESKIVACVFDAENIKSYLDNSDKIAARFETENGIITVIVTK